MGKENPSSTEAAEILGKLESGERNDILILFIPSHDRNEKKLSNQDLWATTAITLFGDLFGGATSFVAHEGVYKSDDGKLLRDKPILIQCYAKRQDVENVSTLKQLLQFIKRMGKETKQAAVGLIVNDVFHEITDFRIVDDENEDNNE